MGLTQKIYKRYKYYTWLIVGYEPQELSRAQCRTSHTIQLNLQTNVDGVTNAQDEYTPTTRRHIANHQNC